VSFVCRHLLCSLCLLEPRPFSEVWSGHPENTVLIYHRVCAWLVGDCVGWAQSMSCEVTSGLGITWRLEGGDTVFIFILGIRIDWNGDRCLPLYQDTFSPWFLSNWQRAVPTLTREWRGLSSKNSILGFWTELGLCLVLIVLKKYCLERNLYIQVHFGDFPFAHPFGVSGKELLFLSV
jgi:hypothetical protein